MEPPKTREEFLARFEKEKERRRIMIKNMKEDLKKEYYKEPQFRNPTNSLRSLRSKPPRMRFLLFKQAFCHILSDIST